jgi:type IV secretory pathway VirJ component
MKISKFLVLLFTLVLSWKYCFGQAKSLPLIMDKSDTSKYLVFHITGDGGWKGFDVKLAGEFKAHHMSYIFLNSLKYFWSAKTPDQLADDIAPVIRQYCKNWDNREIVLVGFSFGAEVMPFLYNRLPEDLKNKVKQIVLITPAGTSDFTIHLSDMMGADHSYAYNVVKEVENIKLSKVLVIFGEKEDSTFPEKHKQDNFRMAFVKGSHHFTDAKSVMEIILKELQ